jgi:2-keto-4-pentenoate hydratase/2-oxohepta-3-ene-1,7-dioic acid hydratase in catechol pathway
MALWLRFEHAGRAGFGTLEGDTVRVCVGDMLGAATPTGETLPLAGVKVLAPLRPSKLVALVNNYREATAKQGIPAPAEPLYFLKAPSSFLAPGEPIRLPGPEVGKVIYEGEIGVVIGREARGVAEAEADAFIFGYTCVNDVTAIELIGRDPSFAQWTRAKGFDTFGPFGPAIATGLDPERLTVRTLLKGKVRQEYPCSDMVFPPRALVSRISREMTLLPGDLIACGTSVGIGVLRAGTMVEVAIEGIGTLSNPVVGPEDTP